VPFIEDRKKVGGRDESAALRGRIALASLLTLALAGCARVPGFGGATPAPSPVPAPSPAPSGGRPAPAPSVAHPPAPTARNWDEYRRLAARRIVAANPGATYDGRPPEPLLAIPVLEIELHADGSIRRIEVLRQPGQARDTTQLAVDAVRRAAPFGDVSRLPRPWKFAEVFLFDDNRRFKLRTLDP
jgi:hypothetical protein